VLKLIDKSTVVHKGVIEDVMISINSWEYPTYFLVLQPNTKFNGYPLILQRPWLETVDAFIDSRARNMKIKNGQLTFHLVLYPLAQPLVENDLIMWIVLETTVGSETLYEDDLINNFLQTQHPATMQIDELVEVPLG